MRSWAGVSGRRQHGGRAAGHPSRESAAAFESAQRWRADLTDMVELRDRSLQACEARYAALDTRAQSLAEGVCPN